MQRSSHPMGCLLLLSSVLMLAVGIGAEGHASGQSPAEDYWQMLLPNSPVPQPILQLTPIDNSAAEQCPQEASGAQQSSAKQISSESKFALDNAADEAMPRNKFPYGMITLAYAVAKTYEATKYEDRHHKNKPGYVTAIYTTMKTDETKKYEDKHHKNKPRYLPLSYATAKTDETKMFEDKHHKNKPGYVTVSYAAAKTDETKKHEDKHHKNKPGYITIGYAAAKTDETKKQEDKHHKNKPGYLTVTYPAAKTDETKKYEDKHDKNKRGYVTLFLERQLRPGSSLLLDFAPTPASSPAFLRRCAADAMPFSTSRLPEILSTVGRGSAVDADDIATTLEVCERPVPEGEAAGCATSLESLVGFAVSTLGTRDVRAVSSAVPAGGAPLQRYNITAALKIGEADTFVGCHSLEYPYAVFFCHPTGAARAYAVSLRGADGVTAVEAVAMCHTDTSRWDPNHVAFQMLHVKRGTVPVCHFFSQSDLVWLRN